MWSDLFLECAAGISTRRIPLCRSFHGAGGDRLRRVVSFLFVHLPTSLADGESLCDWLPAPLHRARSFRSRTSLVFHATDRLATTCSRRPKCARLSGCVGIYGACRVLFDRFRKDQRDGPSRRILVSGRYARVSTFALCLFPRAARENRQLEL